MVIPPAGVVSDSMRQKWQGSSVTAFRGKLEAITRVIPEFDRRPFHITPSPAAASQANPGLDVVVRKPWNGEGEVPVGVVSKAYTLVPHTAVFTLLTDALRENHVGPGDLQAEVLLTRFGERMEMAVSLPSKYEFDPGDGHPLSLQVRCINSVDGSTRFMLVIGWLRFICSNGLVVGTTSGQMRQVHNTSLDPKDIVATIREGISVAVQDRTRFREWRGIPVSHQTLAKWVDSRVKKAWGVKAATRTFHIVQTGSDVELVPFESGTPSQRPVEFIGEVPGASFAEQNAYTVSQALAWLARGRGDLQQRTAWILQIPKLMDSLLAACLRDARARTAASSRW